MSDSTPIVYSDAIDPSLMPTFIAQAKEAIALLVELEAGFRSTLKASTLKGSPTTMSDYTIQADGIIKADNAFKGLIATEKKKNQVSIEALQLQKRLDEIEKSKIKSAKESASVFIKAEKDKLDAKLKFEKAAKDALKLSAEEIKIAKLKEIISKAEAGSLNQKKAQLALVTIEINKMSEAELKGTEGGKALIETQLRLTEQLNKTEQAGGNFHRQVGNYGKSSILAAKGIAGLSELVGRLGMALGIDTSIFENLEGLGKSLIKSSKEFSHVLHLQHLAHNENTTAIAEETAAKELNTTATEAQTVAEEEEAVVSTASIGIFGLVGAAVGLLALGIWSLVDSKRADITYTKEEIKALYEYMRASKEKNDFDKAVAEGKKYLGNADDLNEEIKKLYEKLDAEKEIGGQEIDQMKRVQEQMEARGDDEEYIFAQSQKIKKAELAQLQQRQKELGAYASGDFKLQKEIADKKNELYVDQLTYEHKVHLEEEKDLADWAKRMEDIYNSVYQKDFNKPTEAHLTKLDVDLTAGNEQVDATIDTNKRLKELDDKKTQEELENINKVTDAIGAGLNRRNEAYMDSLKIQSDQIESELSVQESLFKDGLDNTLAYDEKAKAENTEKELAQARKAAKEKKALELSHTYISFLQSFLKDGSNPESAAVKALASTLVSEGIADAIAGSAFDGVEDTGGKGTVDDKGGKLWVVHPNERIVPKDINDKLQGISNDDLGNMFDNDFNALYRPNFLANIPNDSIGGKGNVDMVTLIELNGKMIRDGIEKGFSKIQVTNYDLNVYGKIVETHTSNGISKTYTHQSDVFK